MADIISVYETTDADGDGSLAITTVPNNADLCVVTGMGWGYPGSWGFTELNFADDAGQDFTQIHEIDGGNAIYSCEAMHLRSGDTGFPTKGQAATLYFNTGVTSFSEGFHVSCIFVSDADISGDPIRDSEVDDTIATFESSLTGVLSEDLTIVHWIRWDPGLDCAPSGYGQTEDAAQNVGGTYSAIGYEQGEDVIRVEGADADYGSGGAFAIKNAAGTTETEDINLDALLQKTLSSSFNIDSLLQRNIAITLSIDSILTLLKTIQTNIDAQLWKSYTSDLSIDSLLQQIGIQTTLSVDALISKQLSSIANLDAILEKAGITTSSIDAQLWKSYTSDLSIDSLLQQIGIQTTLSVDALISKQLSSIANLDAILEKAGITTSSIDAILNKTGLTKETALDAILYAIGQEIIITSIDALLQEIGLTSSTSIDLILQKTALINTSFDALLNKVGLVSSVSIDAILLALGTGAEDISFDAMINKSGLLATLNIDAMIQRSSTGTNVIDALLIKALTASLSFDALVQKNQLQTSSIDASLYYLRTIETNIDAILYSFSGEVAWLDSLLLQVGQTATATLDASIYRNVLKTSVIDSVLLGTLSRQIDINALLKGEITSSSLLDAVIYSVLIQANPFQRFVTIIEKSSFVFQRQGEA